MRHIPILDQDTIAMFALSGEDISLSHGLLCSMGRDSAASVVEQALQLPEKCVNAAMWSALRSCYPWPWLAADLDAQMLEASEERGGQKLLCALIACQAASPGTRLPCAPSGVAAALASHGVICSPSMACPHDLASMGHRKRAALASALRDGDSFALPAWSPAPALGAWALPLLYTPSRFGPYHAMDAQRKALLSQSCADLIHAALRGENQNAEAQPQAVLLGLGPFCSILESAPSLCAPLSLRGKLHGLCQALMIAPSHVACSVSFHQDGTREFMRVGLRPNDTGFCLAGFDWSAHPHGLDHEFGRLLDALESCGIEWCYQVEGRYDSMLCPHCLEPIYPSPSHPAWSRMAIEAGAPPDGSHLH